MKNKKHFSFQSLMNVIDNVHITKNGKQNQELGDSVHDAIQALLDDGVLTYQLENNGKPAMWRTPRNPIIIYTGQRILRYFNLNPDVAHALYNDDKNGVHAYKLSKLKKVDGVVKQKDFGFVITVKQRVFLVEF